MGQRRSSVLQPVDFEKLKATQLASNGHVSFENQNQQIKFSIDAFRFRWMLV